MQNLKLNTWLKNITQFTYYLPLLVSWLPSGYGWYEINRYKSLRNKVITTLITNLYQNLFMH